MFGHVHVGAETSHTGFISYFRWSATGTTRVGEFQLFSAFRFKITDTWCSERNLDNVHTEVVGHATRYQLAEREVDKLNSVIVYGYKMFPWAHQSARRKRHLDRFSRFRRSR